MKNLLFADKLLLRMPANSWNNYSGAIQLNLDNVYFRTAVFIASPLFFSCLEQKEFIYEALSEKEKLTLCKYLNRFCFRPTPFGLFAGVSLISWGPDTQLNTSDITGKDIVVVPEQAYVLSLSRELLDMELMAAVTFETNPTLYRLLEEFRFISTEINEHDQARKFLLQSIEYSSVLKELAIYCAAPKSRQNIISAICRLANCSFTIGEDYLDFLLAEQFLVEHNRAKITGPGYLEILLEEVTETATHTNRTAAIVQITNELRSLEKMDTSVFRNLNEKLSHLISSGLTDHTKNHFNVLLNRKLDGGSLANDWQHKIGEAIFALNILCPNEKIGGMEQFIRAFQKDFEGQDLGLLYALDPEVGIGYISAETENQNQLLETLIIPPKKSEENTQNWTPAHSFLLQRWHDAKEKQAEVIRLNEEDLTALNDADADFDFLGYSVLFRIFKGQVYIESAGGVNAPSMMGRFTVGNQKITEAARNMARQQEADNPEIIFAEILHLADPRMDNVNRRETIWSYEIPITAASSLPKEQQLELSDLKIRIENGKVMLYSEKHGKRVIPRLSSAYNHSIDKLPLFRFLADLPYHNGRNGFHFDLRQFFPGLSSYPRVEYKQSILCLATWIISEKQLQALMEKKEQMLIAEFRQLARKLKLPPVFSISEGDQQLVFFRDREEDIIFFGRCIKQKKQVILTEYLLEEPDDAIVKDNTGAPVISQFNTYIIPRKAIEAAPVKMQSRIADKKKRKFIPGSEWLYLKIYTSKIGSKRLLLKIMPLIRRKYTGGYIHKWFFVRYEDHAPHIRLRMQILPADISEILIAFKNKLENGINEHVIREYKIDVYNRELERYHAAGMEATENFFWASSELAIKLLKVKEKDEGLQIYQVALITVRQIIDMFIPDIDLQLRFTEDSYLQFVPEFEGKTLRVDMDKKYRELAKNITQLFSNGDLFSSFGLDKTNRQFVNALRALLKAAQGDAEEQKGYVRSLIHMHLNRIFTDEARKQEMVVYYLLFKFLRSEQGRRKSDAA